MTPPPSSLSAIETHRLSVLFSFDGKSVTQTAFSTSYIADNDYWNSRHMQQQTQTKIFMNKSLNIVATVDQPGLLESLVEKIASRRYDIGYSKEVVPQNWQAIETSSTETYVSGTLSFSGLVNDDDAFVNMPFITSMLFTCIKGKEDSYRLLWSSSLS
jgi:predicted secreted acid phosphatase